MASTAPSARKRALTSLDDMPETKRRRTSLFSAIRPAELSTLSRASPPPTTADEVARRGLRRSIALVLDKVGFDAASEEAMESFSNMVETCMTARVVEPVLA